MKRLNQESECNNKISDTIGEKRDNFNHKTKRQKNVFKRLIDFIASMSNNNKEESQNNEIWIPVDKNLKEEFHKKNPDIKVFKIPL